jgi:protein-tyrosine-phosphatase
MYCKTKSVLKRPRKPFLKPLVSKGVVKPHKDSRVARTKPNLYVMNAEANPKRNLIICVCTANVCRSPMAEKLLQHALEVEAPPLRSLRVVSAGTSAFAGDGPSTHSVQVLKKVGLDLLGHRSQPLSQALLDRAFLILCMTSTHKLILESQLPEAPPPYVCLFREWLLKAPGDIEDPYGQTLEAYEACRDSLVEAIPSIIQFLKTHYPS